MSVLTVVSGFSSLLLDVLGSAARPSLPGIFIQLLAASVVIVLGYFIVRLTRNTIAASLRLQITLWTGLIVAILSITLVVYSISTTRQAAINAAQKEALAIAEAQSGLIQVKIGEPLVTARSLAQSLRAVKDPQNPITLTRDQANAMLKAVLEQNPNFLGTYTLWEPNAFDGRDDEFKGAEAHDGTGRFIPYWIYGEDGSISVSALIDYETPGLGDWYILPRDTKKEVTIAPLIYPINGVDTVMASFVEPIVVNGIFYGIAGVDAPIGFVQDIVDSMNLYDGNASAALLTDTGTLIAVRNRPEFANEPATEIYPDFDAIKQRIVNGEVFISLSPDGKDLRVFAPVDIGNTGTRWTFCLTIPFSEITAQATASAIQQTAISIGLIILSLLALWYFTGQIVRPIRKLTDVANAITTGDLNATAEIKSLNETGILANAFNGMTSQLRETLASLEQRVAERTRNLELAAEVGRTVSQVRALDVMLKDAAELIRKQFDLYYVQVYLADPSQTNLILQSGTGSVGEQLINRRHRLTLNTNSINGRAAIEKKSVVISDTTASATFKPNPLLPRYPFGNGCAVDDR